MDKELYFKLKELRSAIRAQTAKGGKVSVVCSDESLSELARLQPRTREELILVSGLGKVFVEKYGNFFLTLLNKYHNQAVKSGVLCPEVKETLKNLENRLVSINKRNRLLYMPKLSANAFDLVRSGDSAVAKHNNIKIVDFVKRFEENKRLLICDSTKSLAAEKQYNKLRNLMREVNRIKRENGENDLYVAYPFVIGKMSGEDFSVRAPLVLFPVEVILEPTSVCIKMDTAKDILYNSSLLLSFQKFNGRNASLPSTVLEEVDAAHFKEQVTRFYNGGGIRLQTNDAAALAPFTEYTAAEFPKFKSGEFFLEENMVLGKFSMYSSALQKDFKDIIDSKSINELLNDLLQRYEDVDYYADSDHIGSQPTVNAPGERGISYINTINNSQENAIYAINRTNKLVVQGPPGTGKSQTITGMIADFTNKGKNVLMVSQKKAALDVIYSRLGNLAKYTLLIHDVKDKDFFYEQLYSVFSGQYEGKYQLNEFNSVSDSIDAELKRLDTLANKMYFNKDYGVEIYKIYQADMDTNLNRGDLQTIQLFQENIPIDLYEMGFPQICSCSERLRNETVLAFAKEYYDLSEQYNWLNLANENLSLMTVNECIQVADDVVSAYAFFKSQTFFKRSKAKKSYVKLLRMLLGKSIKVQSKSLYKLFYRNPIELYNGLSQYQSYISAKAKFAECSANEKLLFGVAYNICKQSSMSLERVLSLLPQFAAYYYINAFEVANRDALNSLENFDIILRDILAGLSRKREISKECLKASLTGTIHANMLASKRRGEMERIIDGKRKWSIPRFISKFSFELFKGIKIWLLTPEVVSEILPLENGLFDLLIFDEASQIYIEKGVPSIARAKKVVIAGDHKQLRPSSLGMGRIEYDADEEEIEDAALEEESLLDLARFKYPEVLLNYHYRSKYEELIAFSNYAFYKGRLNVSPNVDKPEKPPIQVHYIEDGKWLDRKNAQEAQKTLDLLCEFFKTRKHKETIGIITFNVNQRDLIQDMIDDLSARDSAFANIYREECSRIENGEDVGLFVKNIENVQGDERDHIIFSLAYAKGDNGKVVRNFGWLNQVGGENRLNVAISRAKKKIDIVTSVHPSELKVEDLTNDGPRILKKYLEYAYCISDGNTKGAQDVLASFRVSAIQAHGGERSFVNTVAARLIKEGFILERDVGIGAYKIDIAIKNKQGKYVMGIECDSSLYTISSSARERDVHRRVYLESRGWTLYRLWSSNWWRDSSYEIGKIKKTALAALTSLKKEK